jgi:hypothetical protein
MHKKHTVVEGFGKVAYTTDQEPGAWPNGSRVVKGLEPGKGKCGHETGDEGTVIGSAVIAGKLTYFIEWDDRPGVPVATIYFQNRLALKKDLETV